MANLLRNTLDVLARRNYGPANVTTVMTSSAKGTWAEFAALADFEYDSGYGWQQIAPDLVLMMDDGSWFERREYDGMDWWEHCTLPIPPNNPEPLTQDALKA